MSQNPTDQPDSPADDEFDLRIRQVVHSYPAEFLTDPDAYVRQCVADAQARAAGVETAPRSEQDCDFVGALLAVIEVAFQGVLREGSHHEGDALAIADFVDRVQRSLWEDRIPDRAARRAFFCLAADVMRRTLYRLAQLALKQSSPEIAEISEPANVHKSLVRFDAAEAVDLHTWWETYASRYGDMATIYALCRFAGRSFAQVGELLAISDAVVSSRFKRVRKSIAEFRESRRAGHLAGGASVATPATTHGGN